MQHAWGDDWNWGAFYVVKEIEDWFPAFNEFVKRAGEANPELRKKMWEWCYEHKDNIYYQNHGYSLNKTP